MRKFTVFFEHQNYGYYSTVLEDFVTIDEVLNHFINNHAFVEIYGIMTTF